MDIREMNREDLLGLDPFRVREPLDSEDIQHMLRAVIGPVFDFVADALVRNKPKASSVLNWLSNGLPDNILRILARQLAFRLQLGGGLMARPTAALRVPGCDERFQDYVMECFAGEGRVGFVREIPEGVDYDVLLVVGFCYPGGDNVLKAFLDLPFGTPREVRMAGKLGFAINCSGHDRYFSFPIVSIIGPDTVNAA